MYIFKEYLSNTPILLRDLMVQVGYRRPNRAIDNSLTQIDLDKFSEWADELSLLSLRDPLGREYGRSVYVTSAGKVLVENAMSVGQKNGRGQSIQVELKAMRNSYGMYLQRVGTVMHSHGALDFPPSPQDMVGLLLDNSVSHNELCVFVSTTSRKILIFRTELTPSFTNEQAIEFCHRWNDELIQRRRRPILTRKTDHELQQETQERIMDEKAQELHLAVFVAKSEDNIAHLVRSIKTDRPLFR